MYLPLAVSLDGTQTNSETVNEKKEAVGSRIESNVYPCITE